MEAARRKLLFFVLLAAGTTTYLWVSSVSRCHPFCLQLIHTITPFNRGQAVKDPITEVKHTFHIFSGDLSVDYKFYVGMYCDRRRVHAWSGGETGKVARLGRERLCQNGRARVGSQQALQALT